MDISAQKPFMENFCRTAAVACILIMLSLALLISPESREAQQFAWNIHGYSLNWLNVSYLLFGGGLIILTIGAGNVWDPTTDGPVILLLLVWLLSCLLSIDHQTSYRAFMSLFIKGIIIGWVLSKVVC